MSKYEEANKILSEKFSKDNFIGLTTTDGARVITRIVNAYYEDGALYFTTNALSNKMKQIEKNPVVAVFCAESNETYINAHGVGENMGHVLAKENAAMMEKLRKAFYRWYDEDGKEDDPNSCLVRIRLTDGLYSVDFVPESICFAEQTV